MDRVDEILEGYRSFTALAAEVSNPDGSGILARHSPTTDPTPSTITTITATTTSDTTTLREEGQTGSITRIPDTRQSTGSKTDTLGDYAPVHQQEREWGEVAQAQQVEVVARRGQRRRDGPAVPYFDPASDPVMVDALRLLFAKEGNYVQDLVRTLWVKQVWCGSTHLRKSAHTFSNRA